MPIIAILSIVIFAPVQSLWMWITPLPSTIQEQLDAAVDHGFDGIIVYVDKAGSSPVSYAAGWKNRENKVPADSHGLFKIASISKLYIAVAAVKLIEAKRLSPDDTLGKLLPGLIGRIENAEQITLRMLLQHRSGIPNWIDDKDFPWGNPPKDIDQVLKLVLDDPAKFKPDSRHQYSNTNYLLIGKILDKTLGYSHHQYIKEVILDPLGLRHTFGTFDSVAADIVMSGYDSHYEGDVKMLDFVAPGGSMIANAQDVGIFLRALNNGSLFNGNEQSTYSGLYEYEHTGLLPGYQSIARYHKDIDAVVIQFVNTTGKNTWTQAEVVYNRIVKIVKKQS